MGNQYSWQRSRKYDEYDNVGSGLYRQWICYIFHCIFFCMLHSFSERKIACTDKKSIFRIYSETKSRGIPENLFSDLSDICKFSYGAVCRSCDSRKYVVVTLSILKMPYALLIGTLIAFTALIPIFGAFIGCAVGCFLIFMISPKQAILFIIVFLILQQIEGNLIYPHVVGGSVGLPSIWVLAAVTIGGNLMGIVGMLIFIPLVSVLYTIFREFVYLRLKEKNIKQVTKTVVEEYTAEEIAAMEKNIKKNRE